MLYEIQRGPPIYLRHQHLKSVSFDAYYIDIAHRAIHDIQGEFMSLGPEARIAPLLRFHVPKSHV
ncbi:hypothetical protein DK389_16350 [Methylobacterium durans]|uniref:Uncharacterized protein n=1 Tax=Methylobacterium durans TaxID=2202825 RepID=A0A2U8W6S2_9HYPH|nr:hypothetical protein DK389_16350 [Methylobacterium durans]